MRIYMMKKQRAILKEFTQKFKTVLFSPLDIVF
jgi:hypothetical protein